MKTCAICKKSKPEKEFYTIHKRGKEALYSYCKTCARENTVNRQRKYKEEVIKYAGGKCTICGYNKCMAALEFHHIDESTKDPSFAIIMRNSSTEKRIEAIKDCVLVCANCHRELHYS